ncbi:MAG: CapA family protein [Marinifilaceae bacterium]
MDDPKYNKSKLMGSILFTGDFCPIGRVSSDLGDKVYNDFLPILYKHALTVINLECPLCDDEQIEIPKTGPNIRAELNGVELLKCGNFNLATLANNHILDYGEGGLKSTIKICKAEGIDTVGAGANFDDAQRIFFKEIDGVNIAILNFTENEFSTTNNNEAGANPLNIIRNFHDIKYAKSEADFVFVVIHGGHEGYNLPSPRMKQTYQFFVDAGASAIIGHHSHCYSGFEIYKGVPIFYSLGNFIFDDETLCFDSAWTSGYAVGFYFNDGKLDFKLYPYKQNNEETVGVRLLTNEETCSFETNMELINNIIEDEKKLELAFSKFIDSRKRIYLSYIEPFSGSRFYSYLFNKNLLPSIFTKRKKRLMLNLVRCEAHRDLLMEILKK